VGVVEVKQFLDDASSCPCHYTSQVSEMEGRNYNAIKIIVAALISIGHIL